MVCGKQALSQHRWDEGDDVTWGKWGDLTVHPGSKWKGWATSNPTSVWTLDQPSKPHSLFRKLKSWLPGGGSGNLECSATAQAAMLEASLSGRETLLLQTTDACRGGGCWEAHGDCTALPAEILASKTPNPHQHGLFTLQPSDQGNKYIQCRSSRTILIDSKTADRGL